MSTATARVGSDGDDWKYPRSEDESPQSGLVRADDDDDWRPECDELETLYAVIEAASEGERPLPPLEWASPGRRAAGEARRESLGESPPDVPQLPHNTNFDFMDEMGSLSLRMRREGEDTLRGSAKKKTSSFDGIVSNMMRHKRMEQMERLERDADDPPSSTAS